jgi:uncharacterized protein GlcG (DUF336 family)
MTASVVDEAGRLVMTVRGDGAGFFSPETSRAKAVAAVAFRRATKEMSELHAKAPRSGRRADRARRSDPAEHRGVPIVLGGRVIGAIGCGGGTGDQDHECAGGRAEAAQK